MPFGKFRGSKMGDVPANYLLWLDGEWERGDRSLFPDQQLVWDYVKKNRAVLEDERRNGS